MSLVLLAHACSHLQNASLARLSLTSLPLTTQLHTLLLQLQKGGYVNTVIKGGPTPPPPSPLAPTMSANPEAARDISGHVAAWGEGDAGEGGMEVVTQSNIASRRLWVGLKYYNSKPVLEKMRLVSKPTRRVWMGVEDLEGLLRGQKRGYVKGMRGVGEALYLTTDRGIMEVRECVERRVGGMVLCRVNGVEF